MSLLGPAVAFFTLPKTYNDLMPKRSGSTSPAIRSAIRRRQRQCDSTGVATIMSAETGLPTGAVRGASKIPTALSSGFARVTPSDDVCQCAEFRNHPGEQVRRSSEKRLVEKPLRLVGIQRDVTDVAFHEILKEMCPVRYLWSRPITAHCDFN